MLRTKHPGINKVMYFMQFNAARTAHICISERQNNLFNTKGHKHEG